MKINYPTWKVQGGPTPNEKLVICDECGNAEWTCHGLSNPALCYNRHEHANKGNRRMREATAAEYVAGKAALKTIIG